MKKRARSPKKQPSIHGQKQRLPAENAPKGLVWMYGRHAVVAALANPKRHCHRLIMTAEFAKSHGDEVQKACKSSTRKRPDAQIMARPDLEDLAFPSGPLPVHQGIIAHFDNLPGDDLTEVLEKQSDCENSCFVILDQASDPQNIGAVLRSCAAFGASGLIMQDRNAPELTPSLAKVACGALETVPVIRQTNLSRAIEQLKEAGYWTVGLDGYAEQPLHETNLKGKTVLIMGAEGQGLRRLIKENCDFLALIPIQPEIESLNLSNATAISLYEVSRQLLSK